MPLCLKAKAPEIPGPLSPNNCSRDRSTGSLLPKRPEPSLLRQMMGGGTWGDSGARVYKG